MNTITALDIAKMIDHSLLNPKFTQQEVAAGCRLAVEYGCITVCVKPCDAALAVRAVGVSRFGCTTTAKMVQEAREREAKGELIVPAADDVQELAYLRS
jgi:deoxyribose-phosphate aldolase